VQEGEVAPRRVQHPSMGVKWLHVEWEPGKTKVKSGSIWELGVGSAPGYSPGCSAKGVGGDLRWGCRCNCWRNGLCLRWLLTL